MDALTGLADRPSFDAQLEAWIAKKRRSPALLSVVVADVDLFGAINDEYGRAGGDGVLCALAAALQAHLPAPATVFRFGGDAFAALLPEVEKEQAFLQMEAFRVSFSEERKLSIAEKTVSMAVTVSMGLSTFPDDGAKAQDVIHKANEALYRAKVSGRNKICLAREEKMVTKTSHYMQGQLLGLRRLAEREKIGEALLLREALNDLLRKHNA
tara:strand:- start:278 stop:913 length:636 start_codon:yes stop_codon:yes gene_type:complete